MPRTVKVVYEEHDTSFVGSVPYTPELNPVEAFFRVLKHHYKKLVVDALSLNRKFNIGEVTKLSSKKVPKTTVSSLCQIGE